MGTSACGDTEDGQNGSNGSNGSNGANGNNGKNGHDGRDGLDAGNMHIIAVEGIDEIGTDHDDTVVVDFAQDISDVTDIENSSITFSYAHRKGLKLLARGTANPQDHIQEVALKPGSDAKANDGIISAGAIFYIDTQEPLINVAYNENTFDARWATKLSSAMGKSIGIPDAFIVSAVKPSSFSVSNGNTGYTTAPSTIEIVVAHDIPVTHFDAEGNDIGTLVTIPAYTITNFVGSGNITHTFRLTDPVDINNQNEPEGKEFDPSKVSGDEDCVLPSSGITLSFNMAMDKNSTELAIKRKFEETALFNKKDAKIKVSNVLCAAENCTVTFDRNIDLWALEETKPDAVNDYDKFVTCALDLTFDKWELTSAKTVDGGGVANTNKEITFHLTDITHPYVTYHTEHIDDFNKTAFNDGLQFPLEFVPNHNDKETILVTLAKDETSSAAIREQNRYLENKDTLIINFSEAVLDKYDPNNTSLSLGAQIRDILANKMEKKNGNSWESFSSGDDIKSLFGCGMTSATLGTIATEFNMCKLELNTNYRFKVSESEILNTTALDNDIVIDKKDSVKVKQNDPRKILATTNNWIVPPSLVKKALDESDPEAEKTETAIVKLGSADSETKITRENYTLEKGDQIIVTFNKKMNESVTKAHLAYVFGKGQLKGATRYTTDPNDPSKNAQPADFEISTSNITSDLTSWDIDKRTTSFTITLQDNQFIKMDKNVEQVEFSMNRTDSDPAKLSMDQVRLAVSEDEPIVISKKQFDPDELPTLLEVKGEYKGTRYCGNQLAEAGDTITFTFSEALRENNKVEGKDKSSVALITDEIKRVLKQQIISYGAAFVGEAKDGNKEAWADYTGDVVKVVYAGGVFVATIIDDNSSEYKNWEALNSTNRPRFQLDVSKPLTFTFDPSTVVDIHGKVAEKAEAVMDPFDKLEMSVEVLNNVVENDGLYVANDAFFVTFNCPMDNFYTLAAIQEAFDKLMGDGTAQVHVFNGDAIDAQNNTIPTIAGTVGYQVEILPGRSYNADGEKFLSVADVATFAGAGKSDENEARWVTIIHGPFNAGIADVNIPDVTLSFVKGSNQVVKTQAQYKAMAPMASGIWQLSGVSKGMGRVSLDLPIVFSNEGGE